ncbi:MAG TPA: PmeII family type II restriction endonuclease [Anaerolineae bacterium]|nr:PmeII family type II restriction endonuclease [Anaerolineae bacterium]HQK13782.1 PmeII family type II restriction endonuclease [Anaerolineae bacterium]
MNPLDLDRVCAYVNENIVDFHRRRIKSLEELRLERLLTKNPYLFKAKYIVTANELITGLLEAFLSSSEEKLFGDFLEGLAIFVAEMTCGGHKSSAPGVDLEFINNGVHYLISVKSGPNWGNSSQQAKLEQDLKNAVVRVKQSKHGANVQPVLGICYGKSKTSYLRGYLKVVGQNFWYLISENPQLYTDIIEPIGYKAKEHNESFLEAKGRTLNRFTREFVDRFCNASGTIEWVRLVEFNSGNFDLDQYVNL